jgi:hypothetical protein
VIWRRFAFALEWEFLAKEFLEAGPFGEEAQRLSAKPLLVRYSTFSGSASSAVAQDFELYCFRTIRLAITSLDRLVGV